MIHCDDILQVYVNLRVSLSKSRSIQNEERGGGGGGGEDNTNWLISRRSISLSLLLSPLRLSFPALRCFSFSSSLLLLFFPLDSVIASSHN